METQTAEWFHHMLPFIIVLTIFELVMKLIAMWRAGRNNHLAWFIVIGIINTAGILPIIYLLINRKKKPEEN
ncbi:MAG: hypothetical protein DRI94_10470 [Bacteroidetes bacterium]|nr:MAG: hypothetical protein DRI94_10470 [Bacteroidota bacterium]